MKQLHELALRGTKANHLKNDGRLLHSQYMLFMGWKKSSIMSMHRATIQIAYESTITTEKEKEIENAIKYVEKKKKTPYPCYWVMSKHMCPFVQRGHSWVDATTICQKPLQLKQLKLKQNKNQRLISPVQFGMTMLS
jgi:hypothetical protein